MAKETKKETTYDEAAVRSGETVEPKAEVEEKVEEKSPAKHEIDKGLQQEQQLRANATRETASVRAELATANKKLADLGNANLKSLDSDYDDPVEEIKAQKDHIKNLNAKMDKMEKSNSDRALESDILSVTREIDDFRGQMNETYGVEFSNDAKEMMIKNLNELGFDFVNTHPSLSEAKMAMKTAYMQVAFDGNKPEKQNRESSPKQVTSSRSVSPAKKGEIVNGNPQDVKQQMLAGMTGGQGRYD